MFEHTRVFYAVAALKRIAWLRYRICIRTDDRRAALVGQARGLVWHDRILTGRGR